ncbi:mediator of RNA polymerase II transcription subunit 15a-like [Capsicum annuum]|uniref:mediator of RNA polymerase II transcription subunit 15a-like n=1 Tax=Capsicum annuum TaxID=4072 RepID=UPI001FB11577|nr:mediator of RNA polymerase II transcription subunit 15a-like [Capsicum annuum]
MGCGAVDRAVPPLTRGEGSTLGIKKLYWERCHLDGPYNFYSSVGAMDSSDWRTQFLPHSRQRMVNNIRDTLIGHVRVYTGVYTQEVVQELMRIAVMFEEKVYASATSLQDHLQKISFKMRTIDIRYQNRVTNPLLPNAASSGPNAHGAGEQ